MNHPTNKEAHNSTNSEVHDMKNTENKNLIQDISLDLPNKNKPNETKRSEKCANENYETTTKKKANPALEEENNPFPIDCLPPKTKLAINMIMQCTNVPYNLAVTAFFSSLSIAAQRGYKVYNVFDSIIPVSDYFAVSAASGEGKTRCLENLALKPIKENESELIKSYNEITTKEEGKKDKDKQDKDKQERATPYIIYTDATIEGLREAISKGIISSIADSEAGLWLNNHSHKQESIATTLAALCKIWDGNNYTTIRKGSGTVSIQGKPFTLGLMMQHKHLELLINESAIEQGYTARFLITKVRDSQSKVGSNFLKGKKIEKPTDNEAYKQYHKGIREILTMSLYGKIPDPLVMPVYPEKELESITLKLTPDAIETAKEIHDEYQKEQKEYPEIVEWLCKTDNHLVKLAALIAIYENPQVTKIDSKTLFAAYTILNWYKKELLYITKEQNQSQQDKDLKALLSFIKKKTDNGKTAIAYRNISRGITSRLRKESILKPLLELAKDAGHLKIVQVKDNNGKTYDKYQLTN